MTLPLIVIRRNQSSFLALFAALEKKIVGNKKMEEDRNSWIRRTKFSHTVCHRLDPSRLSSLPISIQSEQNNRRPSPQPQVQRNLITNKQRSLSPLPETYLSEAFREARHEQKRFSTPGPRRDKRIMGKISNKDSREPKVSGSKSPSRSPNNNRQMKPNKHRKDSGWTKYLENGGGGGKVSAVETAEEWTVDMSKLFLGLKFAHGAHSRLYHGVYKGDSVAVKIIRVPDDDENGALASRLEKQFIREVTLLSRLHHPNVIKVITSLLCWLCSSYLVEIKVSNCGRNHSYIAILDIAKIAAVMAAIAVAVWFWKL